ncbi:MAG: hypothetical protein H6R10_2789 [Rhodocyclaceae bacterium]|nr:hypothetical protein [Rhodocyclaceae bacterium]
MTGLEATRNKQEKEAESSMSKSEHLFITPWFDTDESWAGFHIEFSGPDTAFAQALSRLARHPALPTANPGRPWFIPALGPESVAAAAAFADQTVVFLLGPAEAPGAKERHDRLEADLRQAGARIGLVLGPKDPVPPAGAWRHVVLAASHARTLPAQSLMALATGTAIAVTGLRSRNDFVWATANHCALVTGEYLLNRSSSSRKPDMLRTRLLKLLALIAADADTREIEEIFRQEPKLAYSLLRLVNSAGMRPPAPITGFAQAIALLGRQQLQRWLQLLVYADPNGGHQPNPLLLQAATRGRLMEALAPGIQPPPETDKLLDAAFMTGAFSLLDTLLNLSMPEILQQLPLPAAVHAALKERTGSLGTLLTALAAADNRDTAAAGLLLDSLGVDGDTFASAQLSALAWASGIRAVT